jgi:hypothetical protein
LRTRNYLLIVCAGAALLPLLGCQRDAIETHRVEIPEPPEPRVRLLGAMIPHDKDIWFFKVTGKLDDVEPLKTPFEDFIHSVRFNDAAEPITWVLPKGWERRGENGEQRYATLRLGPTDDAPELTVHRYPAEGQMGDLAENVIRWGRMYAGVKVPSDEWRQYTKEDKTAVGDVAITFVDMKGPGGKGGGMKAPFAGEADPHAPQENPHARSEKVTYTAPEGWKETDRVVQRSGIEVRYDVALKVEKGGASALLTVSKFPGNGSKVLLMNVNRWRDQLGLPELDEGQLMDALKKVKVGYADGRAVDFTGPGKPPGKGQRRILGVVVSRQGLTWFIKMDGPADLVGEKKAAFDKFLGSVKFDGGNGG